MEHELIAWSDGGVMKYSLSKDLWNLIHIINNIQDWWTYICNTPYKLMYGFEISYHQPQVLVKK